MTIYIITGIRPGTVNLKTDYYLPAFVFPRAFASPRLFFYQQNENHHPAIKKGISNNVLVILLYTDLPLTVF